MELMTIGYEGMDSEAFFSSLDRNGVEVLVDVRELPISRKQGFSKKALTERCTRAGIEYVHFPALGSPRTVRHSYRVHKNWEQFSEEFLEYLGTQQQSIRALALYVVAKSCCLLCFEKDHRLCHRAYVAKAVAEYLDWHLDIIHLGGMVEAPAANQEVEAGILLQQLTIDAGGYTWCPTRK